MSIMTRSTLLAGLAALAFSASAGATVPGSLALFGLGLAGFAAMRRRKQK